MEIGGNIELDGFIEDQEADLIIVKKIVGRFTKHLTTQYPSFQGLAVVFSGEGAAKQVEVRLELEEATISASAAAQNKYVALDAALKELQVQAKKHA